MKKTYITPRTQRVLLSPDHLLAASPGTLPTVKPGESAGSGETGLSGGRTASSGIWDALDE